MLKIVYLLQDSWQGMGCAEPATPYHMPAYDYLDVSHIFVKRI
jgi:hypothetical protein